jgi:nucleoid-associated protein YgaU
MTGLGYQRKRVTLRIVNEVIADLAGTARLPVPWWGLVALGALLGIGLALSPIAASNATPADRGTVGGGAAVPSTTLAEVPADAEWNRGGAVAASTPAATDVKTSGTVRIVKQRDGLLRMARDVYGAGAAGLLSEILASNPQITDPNDIPIGTAIHFPAASRRIQRSEGTSSGGTLHR